jgi:hypothetical protein
MTKGEGVGSLLREAFAVGCSEDDLIVVALLLEGGYTAVNRLNLKNHPSSEAESVVIHLAVFVQRIVAQVVYADVSQTFLSGSAYDGVVKRAFQ